MAKYVIDKKPLIMGANTTSKIAGGHLKCNFTFLQSFLNYSKPIHLSSYVYVVRTAAKQVISCLGQNENVCEMSNNKKKCRCKACKACKTFVFHYQICKFVTFMEISIKICWP